MDKLELASAFGKPGYQVTSIVTGGEACERLLPLHLVWGPEFASILSRQDRWRFESTFFDQSFTI